MEIAGRTLHVYRAQDIPRGATVAFRLRGLPVPGAFGLPYEEGIARVVALALAGAGVLVALRRAVRGRGPRSSPADLEAERQSLMAMLVDLDRRLRHGELPEEMHRREREQVKRRLVEIVRAQRVGAILEGRP